MQMINTAIKTTTTCGITFKKPNFVPIQVDRPETLIPLAMAKPPPRRKRTDQASLALADLNSRIGFGRGTFGSRDGFETGRMKNGGGELS